MGASLTNAQYVEPVGTPGILPALETYVFNFPGPLIPYTGTARLYLDGPYDFDHLRCSIGTAANAPVIVDVLRNGVSIYQGIGQPTIATGSYTVEGFPVAISFAQGDYISFNIVQTGTTAPGADLVISLRLNRRF